MYRFAYICTGRNIFRQCKKDKLLYKKLLYKKRMCEEQAIETSIHNVMPAEKTWAKLLESLELKI